MITIENEFTETQLNTEEMRQARIFSPLNVALLKNLNVSLMRERAAIEVDSTNIMKFVQEEAFLKGQIELVNFLLNTKEEPEAVQSNQAKE